jgi:glyoxylase-like metal-dependent hydrolase (beta-lactamase superfamily II)
MRRDYGEVLPIHIDRTQVTHDGMRVQLAGRELLFADTPGHARHHHCIWDTTTRGWFTGDTFGLSYPEFTTARGPWMLPTSTPVQFEPEVLRQSVQRLLARQPECMYLTHYGQCHRCGLPGRALHRPAAGTGGPAAERASLYRHEACESRPTGSSHAAWRRMAARQALTRLHACWRWTWSSTPRAWPSWLDRPAV